MKQRVNLQYSIDIDELPTETKRLFLSAHKFINDSLSIISETSNNRDTLLTVETLNTIDQIRTSMMNADYILADVQNIIRGYLSYVSSENTEDTNADEQAIPGQMHQDIDFDDLEKKLQLFQSNFENENDPVASQELQD